MERLSHKEKGFEWSGWIKSTESTVCGYHCFGWNFGKDGIEEWYEDKNHKRIIDKPLLKKDGKPKT